MQTFYDVLGVPISASPEEIQRAYRSLLLRVHPDRCNHDNDSAIYNPFYELDAARLEVLEKAHQVLSNPELRAEYDAYLDRKLRAQAVLFPQQRQQSSYALVPYRASAHGLGGGAEDVMRAMMGALSGATEASSISDVAMSAPAAPRATQSLLYSAPMTEALNKHHQQQQQQQRVAPGDKTTARTTTTAAAGDGVAATTQLPVVYTAAIAFQRQPDGTVAVRTFKSSPRNSGQNLSRPSSASAATTTADTPASAAGTAAAAASVTDKLPRRVRVIEEQLVYRVGGPGGNNSADPAGSLTSAVYSIVSAATAAP